LRLRRATLTAEAGELERAIDQARDVAARADGAIADRARVLWARWELARTESPDVLGDVREILLPAIERDEAERMIASLATATSLIARAEAGESALAWFAAAEVARDRLEAPALARNLFLRYADAAPDSLWAPKALLAAAALTDSPAEAGRIRARLDDRYRWTIYVAAVRGDVLSDAFADAERRLDSSLAALAGRARERAQHRDVALTQARIAEDSARTAADRDSVRLACTRLLDSLAVAAPRVDSIRAACARRDSARLRSLIEADSSAPRPEAWRPTDAPSPAGTPPSPRAESPRPPGAPE
ncbi:MAG: hypothetical protein ACODAE_09140, partial [Gemmatimonadota bacterium]